MSQLSLQWTTDSIDQIDTEPCNGSTLPTSRPRGLVADRFVFPPFSILNARCGEWQDRKREWIALGIQSEIGRTCGGNNAWNTHAISPRAAESAQKIAATGSGPSIFDPVLAELAYRWWCPSGGQIVDPFAGGSVRGIVAGSLGYRYWGGDLSARQIEANNAQADEIAPRLRPQWICGDSVETLEGAPDADFVFSCPPYGDLERYSDDDRDLSAQEWPRFVENYALIIRRAVERLRGNRFACFVVGDFRDPRGFYRGFVGKTIEAFEAAGTRLYNEAILVTAVGSASLRVSHHFDSGRKLTKTHQNVLVFCKGDPKIAARVCIG